MVPDAPNRAEAYGEPSSSGWSRWVSFTPFLTLCAGGQVHLPQAGGGLLVEKRRRIPEAQPARCLRGWVGFDVRLHSRGNDPTEPVRCGLLRLRLSSTA